LNKLLFCSTLLGGAVSSQNLGFTREAQALQKILTGATNLVKARFLDGKDMRALLERYYFRSLRRELYSELHVSKTRQRIRNEPCNPTIAVLVQSWLALQVCEDRPEMMRYFAVVVERNLDVIGEVELVAVHDYVGKTWFAVREANGQYNTFSFGELEDRTELASGTFDQVLFSLVDYLVLNTYLTTELAETIRNLR